MSQKIKTLPELRQIIAKHQADGKRVVQSHGVFDLLHVGHIKHLQEAKAKGDILVVTVTPDEFVHKGPNRPAFPIALRLEALAALEVVNFVAANKWENAVETIKQIRPDVYCKGPDYQEHGDDLTGKITEEEDAVVSIGGAINYTSGVTFSSSNLLNEYGNVFDDAQKKFIEQVTSKWNFNETLEAVENLRDLRVLVLGESIIDQYVFCEALGKSGKEPVLVLRELQTQQYAGGAAAIAQHLSEFCQEVTLLSMLGEKGEYENFLRNGLPDNVSASFIKKKGAPTIVKKRFVDTVSRNKTLGVYSIDDSPLESAQQVELTAMLDKLIKSHDLLIVSDYGHGFISSTIAKAISTANIFCSLNAQVNAANIGYHTMNNYCGVDCAIINEGELRHEFRDRQSTVTDLAKRLLESLRAQHLVVTQGSSGASLYRADGDGLHSCPAFAGKVVDKVGSGDAMLALLSCCLYNKVDCDLSLLIGSLAAAQIVETVGNSAPVQKVQLLKALQSIAK
jgi:rfaE bifunctional protein kinase chain/domain/rfaE bifunctional protein nucleotidyltransferase chain/domain